MNPQGRHLLLMFLLLAWAGRMESRAEFIGIDPFGDGNGGGDSLQRLKSDIRISKGAGASLVGYLWIAVSDLTAANGYEKEAVVSQIEQAVALASEVGNARTHQALQSWYRNIPAEARKDLAPTLLPHLLDLRMRVRLHQLAEAEPFEMELPEIKPGKVRDGQNAQGQTLLSQLEELAGSPPEFGKARSSKVVSPTETEKLWDLLGRAFLLEEKGLIDQILKSSVQLPDAPFPDLMSAHLALDQGNPGGAFHHLQERWISEDGPSCLEWNDRQNSHRFHAFARALRNAGLDPDLLVLADGLQGYQGTEKAELLTEVGGRTSFVAISKHLLKLEPDAFYSVEEYPEALLGMFRRIPAENPPAAEDSEKESPPAFPVEVTAEEIDQAYRALLRFAVHSASSDHVAQALRKVADHPEKAFHKDIGDFLTSPHPGIAGTAASILGKPKREFPDDYDKLRFRLEMNGKPLLLETISLSQTYRRKNGSSSTSRSASTDGEGILETTRWDQTYLNIENCSISIRPRSDPYGQSRLRSLPVGLWGHEQSLQDVIDSGVVQITTHPAALALSIPDNRTKEIQEEPIKITIRLGDDKGKSLRSSYTTSGPYKLEAPLPSGLYRLPDLPTGLHTIEIEANGCESFSGKLTIKAEEGPAKFEADLNPGYRVQVSLLKAGRPYSAPPQVIVTDQNGKRRRYLRLEHNAWLEGLSPGPLKLTIGKTTVETTIPEDSPVELAEPITLSVP